MNIKGFTTLLLASAVACAGAGYLSWRKVSQSSELKPEFATFLPIVTAKTDEVARIDVTTATYKLQMVRSGDNWVARDRGDYPLRNVAVGSLITSIAAMKPIEPKTSVASSFSAIGVSESDSEKGGAMLSFALKDGSSAGGVIIGKRSSAMSYDPLGVTFVRQPGNSQAWLVQGTAALPFEFAGWFDETPNYPAPQVRRVRISQDGKAIFDAIKENDFYRSAKTDEGAPVAFDYVNDSVVKKVSAALVSGTFEDIRPIGQMSLGASSRQVRYNLADGLVIVIEVVEANGAKWLRFKAESLQGSDAANKAKQITERQAGWAYKVPMSRINALSIPLEELTTPPPEREGPQGGMPQGMPQGMPPGFPAGMPQGMPLGGLQQAFPQGLPPELLQQLPPEVLQSLQQQGAQGGAPK